MRNCDFWKSDEAERMYKKYVDFVSKSGYTVIPTLVDWLYKQADYALQMEPGQLLQMSDETKERDGTHVFVFVKVTGLGKNPYDVTCSNGDCRIIDRVQVRRADGREIICTVSDRILPASASVGDAKTIGVFKYPDIPEDFVRLMAPKCPLDDMAKNCPLKNPMPCLGDCAGES